MAYQTFTATHPGQPNMFAKVILASQATNSRRKVYTLHLRYPRIIHAEMMTHRVFNRNARSSRAVPIKTMLNEIRNDPFIPWHWTRIQAGMQGVGGWDQKILLQGAAGLFDDVDLSVSREAAWLHGRDMMADLAESFAKAEYHKQVANRLVEPFMWMDMLVTSTHWANFLHLRDHKDAEPHIRDLAVLVGQALKEAEVQQLKPGEWHLPFVTEEDNKLAYEHVLAQTGLSGTLNHMMALDVLKKISSARCARISYKPFDGDGSFERELERFEQLVGNDAVHASPLEHQCTPDELFDDVGDEQYFACPDLHGSLTGFIQFRKTVPNEAIHD